MFVSGQVFPPAPRKVEFTRAGWLCLCSPLAEEHTGNGKIVFVIRPIMFVVLPPIRFPVDQCNVPHPSNMIDLNAVEAKEN